MRGILLVRAAATCVVELAAGAGLMLLAGRAPLVSPYLSDNVLLVAAAVMLVSVMALPLASAGAARASIAAPSTARFSRITRRGVEDQLEGMAAAIIGSAAAITVAIILERILASI